MLASMSRSSGTMYDTTVVHAGGSAEPHAAILQQRLLLLNHASKCTVGANVACPISRHCAFLRRLWPHLLSCRSQACNVNHCMSSRYVLTHYASCVDDSCNICPKVREFAKRDRCLECEDENLKAAKRPRTSFWWAKDLLLNSSAVMISLKKQLLPSTCMHQSPALDKLSHRFCGMELMPGLQTAGDNVGSTASHVGSLSFTASSADRTSSPRTTSPFVNLEEATITSRAESEDHTLYSNQTTAGASVHDEHREGDGLTSEQHQAGSPVQGASTDQRTHTPSTDGGLNILADAIASLHGPEKENGHDSYS